MFLIFKLRESLQKSKKVLESIPRWKTINLPKKSLLKEKTFFFFFNNIYLVTTLLMTILTFTWRKNKNIVQEIKEKIQCYSIWRRKLFKEWFAHAGTARIKWAYEASSRYWIWFAEYPGISLGGFEFNILKSHPVKAKHQYVNRLNPWLRPLLIHYNSLNAVHYLAQNDEHFDSFREIWYTMGI